MGKNTFLWGSKGCLRSLHRCMQTGERQNMGNEMDLTIS